VALGLDQNLGGRWKSGFRGLREKEGSQARLWLLAVTSQQDVTRVTEEAALVGAMLSRPPPRRAAPAGTQHPLRRMT